MEEQNSERTEEEYARMAAAFDAAIFVIGKGIGLMTLEQRAEWGIAAATLVIEKGVEIMTPEQLGQWTGVRAWLETYGSEREREVQS